MYFSSVGGNFLKAQMQNNYEQIRCDLYIKKVAKKHIHSLANINQSIKEARDTLKDIQASSGHCKEVQGNDTAPESNVWKMLEWSTEKTRPTGGYLGKSEPQARQKTYGFQEIGCKNLKLSVSKTNVDGVSRTLLLQAKNEGNKVEEMEYSMQGKNCAGCDMNGERTRIVPAGWLLRDEIRMLADRNVSGDDIMGVNRERTNFSIHTRHENIKEPQGKCEVKSISLAQNGDFQNIETSTKPTGKYIGRYDPPESAKLEKSRRNTDSDGLVGHCGQAALDKASRVKLAQTKSELKENSKSRYLSTADVKIHVSLSKAERKKILQELVSSCTVPWDRSMLERERQRRLHERIHRFFELLFEQEEDDMSDISGDS